MKAILWILGAIIVVLVLFYSLNSFIYNEKQGDSMQATTTESVAVTSIAHASLMLTFGTAVVYADPTDASLFADKPAADIILVTHEHGDHFSTSTLLALVGTSTTLIVPQSVADKLPQALKARATILKNGEGTTTNDIRIEAVPAYNLRSEALQFHPKGRDNGYVLEGSGKRVYIAGDTEGTPEMRALQNIDIAFVPMNLPYTMDVDAAADAVLAFKPKQVYPYHFRGQDGLSDIVRFQQLVNTGDPTIEVKMGNWYSGE